MQFPDLRHKQAGITLIELSVALIVLGVFMAFALDSYVRASAQKRVRVTEERMDIITKALSDYAQAYSRLPCPSAPDSPEDPVGVQNVFGWEIGVNAAVLNPGAPSKPIGSCTNVLPPAQNVGVVPFMTLNIPYEVINDGWGRPFTYAVSVPLTANNSALAGNTHVTTRTAAWIVGGQNINNPKARFCGLENAVLVPNTLRVIARDGAAVDQALVPVFAPPPAEYALIDNRLNRAAPAVPPFVPDVVPFTQRDNHIYPAIVLVSHGPDGQGAFLVNGTNNQFGNMPAGTLQTENWNNDITFRDQFRNLNPGAAAYFDDFVMWLTQDGVMAYNGKASCALP